MRYVLARGVLCLPPPLLTGPSAFAAETFIVGLFQDRHLTLMNRHLRAEFTVERVETLPLLPLTDMLTVRTSNRT